MTTARLPLAGITERLGLPFDGPDLPFDELSGWQWLAVVAGLSVFSIAASVLAVRWQIRRLPSDYFTRDTPPRTRTNPLGWLASNAAGMLVLLLGVVLLLTPGQGILLILTGLVMLDIPGKQRWERAIARRPKVFAGLNWLRRTMGRPDFEPPAPPSDA